MKRSISWILVIALVLGMLPQNFTIDAGAVSEQILDFLFPSAYAEEEELFAYTVLSGENKTCSITGYSGLGGNIQLPSEINGYAVVSIADNAFKNCSGITGDLVIPECVTTIGAYAFCNCSGLTSVEIPNSVTSIGASAFYGCTGMKKATIGNV